MSVGVLLEKTYRQCHARSCLRQDILHQVTSLTWISTQCCGEKHKLGLHSSLVWINSLLACPRLCPPQENAGRTEFMAALILLLSTTHTSQTCLTRNFSIGIFGSEPCFTLPLKANCLSTDFRVFWLVGWLVSLFCFPFLFSPMNHYISCVPV